MPAALNYARVEKALKFLGDNYQSQPSLDEAARHVHLSKFHFQRMFEQWAGVSPKTFVRYLTLNHAKKLLKEGHSTLHTAYDAGLSGTGRLHDLFVKIESVSPGEYKNNGRNLCIVYGFYKSIFGDCLIAETAKGICRIDFTDDKKNALSDLKRQWPNAVFVKQKGKQAARVLSFINKRSTPKGSILLDLKATDFQVKVWEALLKIPEGRLVSYDQIARKIGSPRAARAVGSAIGKNPVAYFIPCHRVIRASGKIGQYRWGRGRKSAMIGWEFAWLEK